MSGDCSCHGRCKQGRAEDLGPARFHRHFFFRHSHGGTGFGSAHKPVLASLSFLPISPTLYLKNTLTS